MTGRTRAHTPLVGALALLLAGVLTGCGENGSPESSERRPIGQPRAGMQAGEQASRDLPREVTVPLDSGNMAYRRGEYEAAVDYFRRAARADSAGRAPGWFGVYMAQKALGNDAAADSALDRAGELSGTAEMHPSPGESSGGSGSGWEHPDTTDGTWTHPDTTGTRGD